MHHFTRRSRGGGERGEMHSINWINFNETLLKHGIKRIVNRVEDDPRRPPLRRVLRVK
jgi:hypothetical protein